MAKVLVVDDIVSLREHSARIASLVLDGNIVVIHASNGKEAVKYAQQHKPDLIIMDISMPDMSGIKAARLIWRANPAQKILFWSQFHSEAYVRELGRIIPDDAIHGYALKSEPDKKLAFAIQSILLRDNPYIDPVVRGVQSRLQTRDIALTDTEMETLLDIAQGLTDRAIGLRRGISVRGVQNRLSALTAKMLKGEAQHLRESSGMEIFNPRTRVVFEGLKRGLIVPDVVAAIDNDLNNWVAQEFDFEPDCEDDFVCGFETTQLARA